MHRLITLLCVVVFTSCGGGNTGNSSSTNNTISSASSVSSVAVKNSMIESLLAGARRGADGIGESTRFRFPAAIVRVGENLYIGDSGNYTIRKMVIATGEVTTFAGSVGVAGNVDGIGAAARFSSIAGITSDGTNLFVTDPANFTIRKIVIATGEVTTFAGRMPPPPMDHNAPLGPQYLNGIGTESIFNGPSGITTDGTNLYVVDTGNEAIRKIVIASAEVSHFAGFGYFDVYEDRGSWDGIGELAYFNSPTGITCDGDNLYVADTFNHLIRKIAISTIEVTTIAGTPGPAGTAGISGTSDGVGTAAQFNYPTSLIVDDGNLYVADTENHLIRKIVIATGEVTTLAGVTETSGIMDGVGTSAKFRSPKGMATDGTNLYVADSANDSIRKIELAGANVSTISGNINGDGIGAEVGFNNPSSITTDGTNLYVIDGNNFTIRKIVIATGESTTLAGTVGVRGNLDGFGPAAQFTGLAGITTDGVNLYVIDDSFHFDNYYKFYADVVRKIVISTGEVTTLETPFSDFFQGITNDGTNLYLIDEREERILKINIATNETSILAELPDSPQEWTYHTGITTDGKNVYLADNAQNKIRKIAIDTGQVSILAQFPDPYRITTDGIHLYVTNDKDNQIRKIVIETGEIVTLEVDQKDDSDGATLTNPSDITTDGKDLFVSDTYNAIFRLETK